MPMSMLRVCRPRSAVAGVQRNARTARLIRLQRAWAVSHWHVIATNAASVLVETRWTGRAKSTGRRRELDAVECCGANRVHDAGRGPGSGSEIHFAEAGLVLVAFDRATLPWHAGQVLRGGENHGGLVLCRRAVRAADDGHQARLLTGFRADCSSGRHFQRLD